MDRSEGKLAHKFYSGTSPVKFLAMVLVIAVIAGVGTGYILAKTGGKSSSSGIAPLTPGASPKTASQDNKTFRDFAEGVIQPKPSPKSNADITEGTHLLIRQGAVPVALTSSVVDLNQYVGKKVKVYGETQKAIKEGWLMDVGKVDVQ